MFYYFIIFQIRSIIQANNPVISNPQILTIKSKGHKQNISPATINQSVTFMTIPLVIDFHISFSS